MNVYKELKSILRKDENAFIALRYRPDEYYHYYYQYIMVKMHHINFNLVSVEIFIVYLLHYQS